MPRTRFSNPEFVTLLGTPGWSLCEGLIREFEEAWRRGHAPKLHDYLRATGPERRALLVELIHVDLEFRLKAGEAARVELYLDGHPELAADRRATLDLLAAEYQLRRRHKSDVTAEEYGVRFPHYADELVARLTGALSEGPVPSVGWPALPGYEIVEELGRGGMGVVYKARDPSLGRHVALKFLPKEYASDPDRLDRFRREARTASALNHPHICTVHALDEHDGRPFIVMEFIEGATLQSVSEGRPTVADAAGLVCQAATALAAAHAAGVVHRDVKPENVMVRSDGYVKVLDFGLARRLPSFARPSPEPGRDTDPGTLLGTVAYMSPEQTRGEAAESASDVFSLGVVLYQLVTGRHPFEAESAFATLAAVASRQPSSPSRLNPEVPAALDGLIEAMLHKDARLRPTADEVEAALAALAVTPAPRPAPAAASRPVLRREPELAALRAALAEADAGRGSLVCVSGEPGIGKTTLVEAFLAALAGPDGSVPDCLVARGSCSERLAGSEAYLPVLDALAGLLRTGADGWVSRLMKVVAPTWHARLTPGAPDADGATGQARSQQAMLREFANFLQEASRRGPVVLFFDDVHWADVSTVDLLAYLARHFQGLRALFIVSYRPADLLLGPHPFYRVRLELQGKGVCVELPLGFLSRADVDHYLTLAFPGHALPQCFADLIYAHTEGSPLFMADLLRDLRERGVVAQVGGRWSLVRELPDLRRELPGSVRGVIWRELERLADGDRRLLSAAAVQGHEFDSAAVAGALGRDAADVEERLQTLDRVHGLIRPVREHELPDRTLTLRYAFVHVLYQQALYADVPPTRRAALATALARVLESHHGEAHAAVSAELAHLYEVGRDHYRAARHFHVAGQNAARVFAHREALGLARRGLALLEPLPPTPERAALELPLQTALGLQLQVIDGFAAPAAEIAYTRARELCCNAAAPAPLFPVLWGLWLCSKVRSELGRARGLAEELRELAQSRNDPALSLQAAQALAVTTLCLGEPASTLRHAELAATLYDPSRHRTHTSRFGQDPGVACKAFGAVALWLLGHPDEARRQSEQAVRLSNELSQPSSQALALHFASMLHQLRRDGPQTRRCAEACHAIAAEHGFSFWLAGATIMSGWATAACGDPVGGTELLRQGLRDWAATGSVTYRTYYLGLLAEVLIGQNAAEAGRVLGEALELARQTGEGLYEAELHRLGGELLLRGQTRPGSAAESLGRALDVARRQGARSLELRTAMSLVRLEVQLGLGQAARDRLAEAHAWFTEGSETADLQEARGLLDGIT